MPKNTNACRPSISYRPSRRTRRQVAQLLGVNRDTVGRWLAAYARGGISQMLSIARAPGKVPLFSEAMQHALRERLAPSQGFASYKAIWQWLRQEYQLPIAYKTVHRWVRYVLRAKLKVARKAHRKNPEDIATFQADFSRLLQQNLAEVQSSRQLSAEHPVRVFCQDETRCGLLPVRRRRLTLSGVKPVGLVQYCFENFYGYGAIEPTTGESFFLELPQPNTINFQIFLNESAQHYQETLNIVLMDNGSCHKARALVIPDNIVCVFLTPYSPELNPIERLWQALKERLAWGLVAQID